MTSIRDPERLVHSRAAEDAELGQLLRRAADEDPPQHQVEQVVARVLQHVAPAPPSLLRRHGPWLAAVGLLLGGAWLGASHDGPAPAELPRPTRGAEQAPAVVQHAPTLAPRAVLTPGRSRKHDPSTPVTPSVAEPSMPAPAHVSAHAHVSALRDPDPPTVEHVPRLQTPAGEHLQTAQELTPRGAARGAAQPTQVTRSAPSPRSPRAGHTSPRAPEGALDDELALLVRAQRALGQAPLEALTALRAHEAAYAHGRYAEERDALVCDALARLGRSEELHAAAAAFLAVHVRSALAPRIARYLDGPSAQRQSTHSDSGPATTLIK